MLLVFCLKLTVPDCGFARAGRRGRSRDAQQLASIVHPFQPHSTLYFYCVWLKLLFQSGHPLHHFYDGCGINFPISCAHQRIQVLHHQCGGG